MTLRMYAASRGAAGVEDLLAHARRARGRAPRRPRRTGGGGSGLPERLGRAGARGSRGRRGLRGPQATASVTLVRSGHSGLLDVDVAGAGRSRHAGLDADAVAGPAVVRSPLRRSRTAPSRSGSDAAEADAHPAAGRHEHAGVLAGVEHRPWRRRPRRRCRAAEGHRAALAGGDDVGPEALGVQPLGQAAPASAPRSASSSPVGPQAHVSRSARSGTSVVEVREVEQAVACRCAARPAGSGRSACELAQLGAEDRRRRGVGAECTSDDVVDARRRCVAEHAHHRGDAAAGGDEQDLAAVGAEDEVPGRLVELHEGAGRSRRTRWLLTMPSGMALTVIAISPSGRGWPATSASRRASAARRRRPRRCGRTGRGRARPVRARAQPERDGVGGLRVDGDDPGPQVGAARSGATRSR